MRPWTRYEHELERWVPQCRPYKKYMSHHNDKSRTVMIKDKQILLPKVLSTLHTAPGAWMCSHRVMRINRSLFVRDDLQFVTSVSVCTTRVLESATDWSWSWLERALSGVYSGNLPPMEMHNKHACIALPGAPAASTPRGAVDTLGRGDVANHPQPSLRWSGRRDNGGDKFCLYRGFRLLLDGLARAR